MIAAFALVAILQSPQMVLPAGQVFSQRLACAPMSLPAPPVPAIQVVTGYVDGRIMFGPGEPLVVNAGTLHGLQVGQQYFVRRYVRDRFTPAAPDFVPNSIHTAGWVTIVDARESTRTSLASRARRITSRSESGVWRRNPLGFVP